MARPATFDDEPLLRIMAELLAWPEYTGVRTLDEAMGRALAYVPGSGQGPLETELKAKERLRKAYAKRRCALELEVRASAAQRLFPGPMLPTVLTPPNDPAVARMHTDVCELSEGLHLVSQWAADLADLLDQQGRAGAINADLRAHTRKLIQLVRAEIKNRRGKNSHD